ncbi:hypothetical protein [Alloalcanivorax xenomutans]|uniref:hypothetical protein n=1 Tax=Alloalcanivorax xenomutans TaxID=1094342 RepID=UPI0024E1C8A1|nr:hypothetical protein [Alloalcanivorax xenomutans]
MSDWDGQAWLNVGIFVASMLVLFAAILEAQCQFFLDGTSWLGWLKTPAFWAVVALDLLVIALMGWTALLH